MGLEDDSGVVVIPPRPEFDHTLAMPSTVRPGGPRRRLISAPELSRRRGRERDDDRDVLPTWKPPPEGPIPF